MSLGYFVDIQGTLLSDEDKSPIAGALELLEYFNKNNIPYTLVTNNTKQLSSELIDELHVKGFRFPKERFIDPLMVLKDVVGDKSVKPFGSEKFCDILPKLGLHVSENPDIILIASDDRFDAKSFADMIDLVLNGATPIGMHATSTYAKNGLRYPGVGAVLAMIEYATGVKADVVGKPSPTFYKKAYEIVSSQKFGSEVSTSPKNSLGSGTSEVVQKLKNSFGCGTLVPPKNPEFRGSSGEAKASHPSYCTTSKASLPNEEQNFCIKDITMISDDGIGDLAGAKDLGIGTNLVLSGKCKSVDEVKSIREKIDKISQNVGEILLRLRSAT